MQPATKTVRFQTPDPRVNPLAPNENIIRTFLQHTIWMEHAAQITRWNRTFSLYRVFGTTRFVREQIFGRDCRMIFVNSTLPLNLHRLDGNDLRGVFRLAVMYDADEVIKAMVVVFGERFYEEVFGFEFGDDAESEAVRAFIARTTFSAIAQNVIDAFLLGTLKNEEVTALLNAYDPDPLRLSTLTCA